MNKDTALLVVDVQSGVVDWSQPTSKGSDEVLERINELLARARAAGNSVIYIQHDGQEEGHPLSPGLPGWQIHPAIAPAEGEIVIHKRACDSFFGTPLEAELAAQVVTFSGPLALGNDAIIGQSIEHLITTTPLFAPIEGLPDEVWKDKTCDTCHQWTQEALCTQATTYLGQNAQRSLALAHPLGNEFKLTLRAWAQGGCQ